MALAGEGAEEGTEIWEVLEGVKRTKAAQMMGRDTISAQVKGVGDVIEVPIKNLRSPKTEIDLTGIPGFKWDRVWRGTQRGDTFPPIEIYPGNRGIPFEDVQFYGEPFEY